MYIGMTNSIREKIISSCTYDILDLKCEWCQSIKFTFQKQYMEEDKRAVPWLPAYPQVEDDLQTNKFLSNLEFRFEELYTFAGVACNYLCRWNAGYKNDSVYWPHLIWTFHRAHGMQSHSHLTGEKKWEPQIIEPRSIYMQNWGN